MRLASGDAPQQEKYVPFPSQLLSSDQATFQAHLQSRAAEISAAVKQIFSHEVSHVSDPVTTQGNIARLLAQEKMHINELEKNRLEVEQLNKYLEDASLRYMLAEKRYDRQKSRPVARMEAQASAGGKGETGGGTGGGDVLKTEDAAQKPNEDALAEMNRSKCEIEAAFLKQKDQISVLASENDKSSAEIINLRNRLSRLDDDDCSRTDLFKHLKSRHEDVIKRINDLEAKNLRLREEAEKLHAERAAHRSDLEAETQVVIAEKDSQLLQNENDLSRIRAVRDELLAEIATRKAAQSSERESIAQMRDLVQSKEDRVRSLEQEIERLAPDKPDTNGIGSPSPSTEEESSADPHMRFTLLKRQYTMLNNELQSMGKAYQKSSALATQKIIGVSDLEEKAARMSAEKAKADQKYFAAMKAKEARDQELRTLRAQNSKSSEIVSQVKDNESANRAMIINLEKQLAEHKTLFSTLTNKHQACQQQVSERNITMEGLKAQVEVLRNQLTSRETERSSAFATCREVEVHIETLKVRLDETEKSLKTWKGRASGDQNSENEMLRVRCMILNPDPGR